MFRPLTLNFGRSGRARKKRFTFSYPAGKKLSEWLTFLLGIWESFKNAGQCNRCFNFLMNKALVDNKITTLIILKPFKFSSDIFISAALWTTRLNSENVMWENYSNIKHPKLFETVKRSFSLLYCMYSTTYFTGTIKAGFIKKMENQVDIYIQGGHTLLKITLLLSRKFKDNFSWRFPENSLRKFPFSNRSSKKYIFVRYVNRILLLELFYTKKVWMPGWNIVV